MHRRREEMGHVRKPGDDGVAGAQLRGAELSGQLCLRIRIFS